MTSPTQRTLAELRAQGYACAVVERWNPHAHVRQDLFGILDVLATRPGEILGVQTCADDGGGVADHLKKLLASDGSRRWLESGAKLEVWGWGKRRSQELLKDGSRSKKKLKTLRRVEITPGMISATPADSGNA